ncbi:MAG: CBS domain-containing protein [Fibrobacter sp.]|nr:CBS domain-containing protein [Fibrobacter sp.]
MFKNLLLFKNRNNTVILHSSAIPVLIFFIWLLSTSIFPYYYRRLSELTYWWMGITAAFSLCLSFCIHEAVHIIISNKIDVPLDRTILFYFGAVSYGSHKGSLSDQILIFVCGPLSNALLAIMFHSFFLIGKQNGFSLEILGLIDFVRMVNLAIVFINLLPFYPFDCGRVVQSILCAFFGNESLINSIFKTLSEIIASILLIFGTLLGLKGNPAAGTLWVMGGYFIILGVRYINQRFSMGTFFSGVHVAEIMTKDIVWVDENLTVKEFMSEYFYSYRFKVFPVSGRVLQCIHSRKAYSIAENRWSDWRLKDIVDICGRDDVVFEKDEILEVFEQMRSSGVNNRFVINEKKEVCGVIVMSDILRYFSRQLLSLQQLNRF